MNIYIYKYIMYIYMYIRHRQHATVIFPERKVTAKNKEQFFRRSQRAYCKVANLHSDYELVVALIQLLKDW